MPPPEIVPTLESGGSTQSAQHGSNFREQEEYAREELAQKKLYERNQVLILIIKCLAFFYLYYLLSEEEGDTANVFPLTLSYSVLFYT